MRHKLRTPAIVAAALCAAALLTACGGGGSSALPPAPSGLSYPAPPEFVVGQTITPLMPSITGSVTTYMVDPALPAGLSLNATTGAISGTPTAVASTAAHTVTASNAVGSTISSVSITVNDVAPSIDYGSDPLLFTTGVPVTPVAPTITGGTPVTWSIHPALPAGLAFNANDGRITGTPTELASPQGYLVVASNSGGAAEAELTISVESGVLLELGHASAIKLLQLTATRALSQDEAGHWVLWNSATAEVLGQGDTACPQGPTCVAGYLPVGLAGATVVVQTTAGLEIRTATDGHVLATIDADVSSWKLASDGTYVVAANTTALRAWQPSGALLFARPGNYSTAIVFAAAAEVRVADGAAGSNVIEQIAISSGTATVGSAFLGDFHSWFLDGERFLTNVGSTVRVYSKAAAQQDLVALPTLQSLTGQGTWFWINHLNDVKVYAVGASATPAATYTYGTLTTAVASGTQLAVIPFGAGRVRIVNLAGATPADAEYQVPHGFLSSFGAGAGGEWLLGNCCGVVLDGSTLSGTVKYFGYGAAWSVAGSATRVAISTASRRILYYDALTRMLEGTIDFDASHIELSSGGGLLAAAANTQYDQFLPDRSLRFYSLPAATLLDTRPYTFEVGQHLVDMSLSASGEFVAENLYDSATGVPTRRVTPVAGGVPTFSSSGPSGAPLFDPVRLSPDGRYVAATDGSVTHIYENGSLIGAAAGRAAGWIDEGRLLLNQYDGSGIRYQGAALTDPLGAQLAAPAIPELGTIQPVGSDLVYSSRRNTIYSLATGEMTWAGSRPASRDLGAVAGPIVVFVSGSQVRVESH